MRLGETVEKDWISTCDPCVRTVSFTASSVYKINTSHPNQQGSGQYLQVGPLQIKSHPPILPHSKVGESLVFAAETENNRLM
jgi:hypothetical protein